MRSFRLRLSLIALAGLVVRVVYDVAHRDFLVQGDAQVFHQVADHLAHGSGFIEPFSVTGAPTAEHPPAWEVVLAAFDLVGANGYLAHRLVGGLIGTVTVVLVALLARRLTGRDGVALAAAGIAAAYPILWTADGSLMSETLYGALVTGALLAGVWAHEQASTRRFAAVGALIGLAALTRGEALGLLLFLVVPLAWGRLRLAAVAVAACVLVLAPWTIRNLVTFDTPVLISSNANGLFIGANCPDVYHGPLIGSWRFQCYTSRGKGEDEAHYFARQRSIGLRYARHHAGRLPAVVVARELREFDLWRVDQAVFLNAQEGRPAAPMRWAIRSSWLVMALALAGIAVLVRRRARDALVVLVSPIVLVTAVAAVTYGTTRFRHAAEPAFCVLAAIALSAATDALAQRRAAGRPAPSPPA